MVNGRVDPEADELGGKSAFRQAKNVYWNTGTGGFVDLSVRAGPAVQARESSRGAAFGDLENNGDVEIVANNLDSTPSLPVNRGEKGNWPRVRPRGTKSNRDVLGTPIRVRSDESRQAREVRSGGIFLSSSDFWLRFGLDSATRVDEIRGRRPRGAEERFPGAWAGREVMPREGAGRPAASSEGDR